MNFVKQLEQSLNNHQDLNAFHINEVYYTYGELRAIVTSIRLAIREQSTCTSGILGLVTRNDIYTYASIIATWLEGMAYLPLNPSAPISRNEQILRLADITNVLDSKTNESYGNVPIIKTKCGNLSQVVDKITINNIIADNVAYILYTSGSTGMPKGVPITFANLDSFVKSIEYDTKFNITSCDRCLQMFELTFDFSVVSFLLPLLSGACVFTIPDESIKYFHIIKLLKEKELTVISLVPSMVHYLRPYFEQINAPKVKYCSFGGSKLEANITREWSNCIPNAKIINYYGPTECTIYSTFYYYNNQNNITHNGVLSIGKPLKNIDLLVLDDNGNDVSKGKIGELCISGDQVTPGYWKNEEKNKESFFTKTNGGHTRRYYRSGDLCYLSEDGYYMYIGRKDFQVKIRGYRVELGEVEYHAKEVLESVDLISIDIKNDLGNTELALVIKSKEFDTEHVAHSLKIRLPHYMVPSRFYFVDEFPHNTNGKIDRKALKELIN